MLRIKVLAASTMLGVMKLLGLIRGDLRCDHSFSGGDCGSIRLILSCEDPDVLRLEEEVRCAGVNDGVGCVVGVEHAVVTSSEEEEADLALGALALSAALHIVDLVIVVLGVVNSYETVTALGVGCLHTLSILEQDALVSSILGPGPNILINIECRLECGLRAPAPAKLGRSCANQCDDRNDDL